MLSMTMIHNDLRLKNRVLQNLNWGRKMNTNLFSGQKRINLNRDCEISPRFFHGGPRVCTHASQLASLASQPRAMVTELTYFTALFYFTYHLSMESWSFCFNYFATWPRPWYHAQFITIGGSKIRSCHQYSGRHHGQLHGNGSKARKEWPASQLIRTRAASYHEQCGSEVTGWRSTQGGRTRHLQMRSRLDTKD